MLAQNQSCWGCVPSGAPRHYWRSIILVDVSFWVAPAITYISLHWKLGYHSNCTISLLILVLLDYLVIQLLRFFLKRTRCKLLLQVPDIPQCWSTALTHWAIGTTEKPVYFHYSYWGGVFVPQEQTVTQIPPIKKRRENGLIKPANLILCFLISPL